MIAWAKYIDLGDKMVKLFYQNTVILSENPLYDKGEFVETSKEFAGMINSILADIAPTFSLDYIDGYGYSDQSIEESYERYKHAVEQLGSIFLMEGVQQKYVFLLGADITTYLLKLPYEQEYGTADEVDAIKNKLIAASIPTEFLECLSSNIGVFVERVIGYLEKKERDENDFKKTNGNTLTLGNVTADNSTVVIGKDISGNITTRISINDWDINGALNLINEIELKVRETYMDLVDEKEDILDILSQIKEDMHAQKQPKKGIVRALKALCAGSTSILPLITELIKLLRM